MKNISRETMPNIEAAPINMAAAAEIANKAVFDTSIFYDGYRTLTYNCLFNFIVGNRGCGKTYFFKKWAIKDFLRTGAQFVYIRRYKDEFDAKATSKFFDDIEHEFPDHKFSVKGKEYFIDGKIAGYGMVLSTSKIKKSVPYPKVNKICFDEFIIDKGVYRYLEDEVTCFLEAYETIARMRDVRVFFMSNAITFTNPYFMYFDIEMPYENTIKVKGDILLQLEMKEEFIEAKLKTRFGKIIGDKPYGEYAIQNKFLRDNKNFIQRKTGSPSYMFGFLYKGSTFGVWVSWKDGRVWVSDDVDPSRNIVYSITLSDHSPNTLLIKNLSREAVFKTFIEAFKQGCVYFENIKIKNVVYEVIRLLLV